MSNLHADDAFLSHYQFSHDPFASRVPGFKFFPAQRKPVLGQLHHLARYSQLLLLVCGPQGSGKTLLRQALVASTNKQLVQSLVLSARDSKESGGIYRQVAAGLDAPAATLEAILAKAGQVGLTGQEVYLLIDDAGLLDDAALQALLHLAAGNGEGRLHVFLFAEPELADRIERLVEGEERCHSIELQPYTELETREYLAQRLDGAGQGIDLLSEDQIEDIHLQSEGWPGGINQVAREVLLDAMLADTGAQRSSGGFFGLPAKHLLAVGVVVVAIAAAWFMQGGGEAGLNGGSEVAGVSAEQPAEPVIVIGEQTATSQAGADAAVDVEVQSVVREPLAQAAAAEEADEGGGVISPTELPVGSPVPEVAASLPLPEIVLPAVPAVPAVPAAVREEPKAAVVDLPKQQAKPAAPVAVAPTQPVVSKQTAAASRAPADSAWYRAQAGSRITLQVLGTRVEQSAQAVVRKLGGEYHYYLKMHQGQPFYVVTYGIFSDRAAAQSALKGLPASIRASKPFPKSFASIQQEMAQSR